MRKGRDCAGWYAVRSKRGLSKELIRLNGGSIAHFLYHSDWAHREDIRPRRGPDGVAELEAWLYAEDRADLDAKQAAAKGALALLLTEEKRQGFNFVVLNEYSSEARGVTDADFGNATADAPADAEAYVLTPER